MHGVGGGGLVVLLRSLTVELHIEEEGEKERHKRTERGADRRSTTGDFN